MLALRLPKDIEDRLTALAKKTGRTKSFYAREAIIEHLEDLEDVYLADERMRDNPEFVEFDVAMKELGISPGELPEDLPAKLPGNLKDT